jgi:hypothetical protein
LQNIKTKAVNWEAGMRRKSVDRKANTNNISGIQDEGLPPLKNTVDRLHALGDC